jgi:NAD-dependent dihydropyrimidine dehydrogenase PreA subunit
LKFDNEKCVGFGECVDICPEEIFELQDEKSMPAKAEECVGCESSVEVCGEKAITVSDI